MLLKLHLDEEGTEAARELWTSDTPLVTARIAQVEVAAALGAAARLGRIDPTRFDDDVLAGEFLWDRANAIEATRTIVDTASRVGPRRGLKAIDALHLASALAVARLPAALVSWDRSLRRAALAEGLPVYP